MNDELVTWLRAQYDEDERIVLDAPRYEWNVLLAGDVESGERTEQRVLDYLMHNSPDRVSAEIGAKRRMLDICSEPDDHPNALLVRGRILALMAQPLADREGYREEWAPS